MATIQRSVVGDAVDGRRIVTVRFIPQVPNPAAQAEVDVVFEVYRVEDASLAGDPYAVVGPLSSTLVDTREAYPLSRTQQQAVIQAALAAVSETLW